MKLQTILNMIQGIAEQVSPFIPAAQFVGIGAGAIERLVDELEEDGTEVEDENGEVLDPEELAARAQATWDRASAKAAEGEAVADEEIARAREAQGKPPEA